MKRFLLMALFVLLLLNGCGKGGKDASLEGVFDKSPSIVMVVDYSDKGSDEKFKKLVDKFPNFGLWQTVVMAYDKQLGDKKKDLSYDKLLGPILNGQWRIGASMTLTAVKKEAVSGENPDTEVVVAGEFSEADEFELFLQNLLVGNFGDKLKYEDDDGVKYWTHEKEDFYLMRDGDLFVLTNSQKALDNVLVRMEDGGSLNENEGFLAYQKEFDAGAGYVFVDSSFFKYFANFLNAGFMANLNGSEIFSTLGDTYLTYDFDENGFSTASSMKVTSREGDILSNLGIVPGNKIDLVNKVNADGVMLYYESGAFATLLEVMLDQFEYTLKAVSTGAEDYYSSSEAVDDSGVITVEPKANADFEPVWFDNFITQMASLSGLSEDEIKSILNSPFALVVSDTGGYFPAVDLYFAVDETVAEQAKILSASMSDYVKQFFAELGPMLEQPDLFNEVLVSDVEVVMGGALNKIVFSPGKLSKEVIEQVPALGKIDLEKAKAAFYYGVTGDSNLVFAFHPDFEKVYGENVLADDKSFKEAVDALDVYGYELAYMNPGSFVAFFQRLIDAGYDTGEIDDGAMLIFDLYSKKVFDFVKTFKYIVGSNSFEDGVLKSSAYVRIEELKK